MINFPREERGITAGKQKYSKMNIMSYNLRWLGRGLKWASIRSLVGKFHVDLLCLQETKKDFLDKTSCQFLWGQSDLDWEWQQIGVQW